MIRTGLRAAARCIVGGGWRRRLDEEQQLEERGSAAGSGLLACVVFPARARAHVGVDINLLVRCFGLPVATAVHVLFILNTVHVLFSSGVLFGSATGVRVRWFSSACS